MMARMGGGGGQLEAVPKELHVADTALSTRRRRLWRWRVRSTGGHTIATRVQLLGFVGEAAALFAFLRERMLLLKVLGELANGRISVLLRH